MCDELYDGGGECVSCPLSYCNNGTNESCGWFTRRNPEEAIRIVEAWAADHPIQTNAQKFEEVFGIKPHKNILGQWYCPPHEDCTKGVCSKCREWWDEPYKGE